MTGATEADRFELKYIPEPNSGCWLWIGAIRGSGSQSQVDRPVMRVKGRLVFASHVAWRLNNAPVPDGLQVLHSCDNPMCVNPAHLFLGTHLDNMRDMVAKGRGKYNPKSKLTSREIWEIRQLRGYATSRILADAYGVHEGHIRKIHRGKRDGSRTS